MRCYIFDLDGTLCDIRHRLHFIQPPKLKLDAMEEECPPRVFQPQWDSFFAACVGDKPIEPICKLIEDLSGVAPIVYVSGRSDIVRDKTEWWLSTHIHHPAAPIHLFMRKDGDHRPDHVIKSEILDDLLARGWEPIMAFDDRQQVVDMWRARGIVCAQVAEGKF